jgi:hypothetical protein
MHGLGFRLSPAAYIFNLHYANSAVYNAGVLSDHMGELLDTVLGSGGFLPS